MRWPTTALVLLCSCASPLWARPAEPPVHPTQVLEWLHADLAALPEGERCTSRYLQLDPLLTRAAWPDELATLNGFVNSFSRHTRIRSLRAVSVGELTPLLRVDLTWFKIDCATWEKFADIDPWFHAVEYRPASYETGLLRDWPGGVWPRDRLYYAPGSFRYHACACRVLTFWHEEPDPKAMPAAEARRLEALKKKAYEVQAWTHSAVPVLRADWLVSECAIQDGRKVGYYGLLNIKTLDDFDRLIRFDPKLSDGTEHLRTQRKSGITLGPRLVLQESAVTGKKHSSLDNEHDGQTALDDTRDPTKTLKRQLFRFKATEIIAHLPNGKAVTALADDQKNLQAKAPDQIVGAWTRPGTNDGRVHNFLACWDCHTRSRKVGEQLLPEDMLKPLRPKHPTVLRDADPEQLRILEDQRLRHRALEMDYEIERTLFRAATAEATGGWEMRRFADALVRAFGRYEDAQLDLKAAAQWLGYPEGDVREAFRQADAAATLDERLSGLLGAEESDPRLDVRELEATIQAAHEVMIGYYAQRRRRPAPAAAGKTH